jgi:hypothetical protein
MLSRQEIYDKVAVHLLTQMKQCRHGTGCVYRNPNGLKCAIGALIPDELYIDVIEGAQACPMFNGANGMRQSMWTAKHRLMMEIGVAAGYISSTMPEEVEAAFLNDLQKIHDDFDPSKWKERLTIFATTRGLVPYVK